MKRGIAATMFCIALVALACGSDETSSSSSPTDGGTDAPSDRATPAPDGGGGVCCPPDPAPGCCMNYGGWDETGSCGFRICDGMVVPSTPGWKLAEDSHGCQYWSEPKVGEKCGAPVKLDAGDDASDASDADAD